MPAQDVQLFGVGTKAISPAVTAQRRINLYVETRKEAEKTRRTAYSRYVGREHHRYASAVRGAKQCSLLHRQRG